MAEASELEISITLGAASFTASGRAEQVMVALDRFTELLASADLEIAEPAAGEEGEPAATVKPAKAGEKEPLPIFLRARTIKGNMEAAAAIVAWAQKHEGKTQGLRSSEIATYWRGTNLKEPGNIGRDLGNAVKDASMKSTGSR
jgi:hypothetical protein